MTFDPMSVEVTCVTLPKDHCVQVPWQYINVCGYSDQFCKIPHAYTYYIHTYYILHTTYRMSDHIVSYWTQFRRDKKNPINWLSISFWSICIYECFFYGSIHWLSVNSILKWGYTLLVQKICYENDKRHLKDITTQRTLFKFHLHCKKKVIRFVIFKSTYQFTFLKTHFLMLSCPCNNVKPFLGCTNIYFLNCKKADYVQTDIKIHVFWSVGKVSKIIVFVSIHTS